MRVGTARHLRRNVSRAVALLAVSPTLLASAGLAGRLPFPQLLESADAGPERKIDANADVKPCSSSRRALRGSDGREGAEDETFATFFIGVDEPCTIDVSSKGEGATPERPGDEESGEAAESGSTVESSMHVLSPPYPSLITPDFNKSIVIEESVLSEGEKEIEGSRGILFPWFIEILGVAAFFLLSRYLPIFPYTAMMFLLGTFMGIGATKAGHEDQLTQSILLWNGIESEVLLLVFLPGLVFSDAFGLNVHLFQRSIWQCLILAFPMVLAGTVLTALVGTYVFPYGWSFNLSMTFGSILSATDPVAVASLLNEVGAPPRLKMLISGESLLNDGSAMVFYTIFSGMFLAELGIEGLGTSVTWGEGFALFFRMALGGALIGVAFGLGLVSVLYLLSRRLNSEENVVQVAATVTVAYLSYYVADVVCHTSGVISTLMCGVTTNALGWSLINDQELMSNFWELVEQLLNTLLFALGGVVWGTIIANEGERAGQFTQNEWGYLILLYVILQVMRFFLVFSFFPIISRIGLGCSWQEGVFSSYGGLRGAVGISLAIALDNLVRENTTNEEYRRYTTQLFGSVGGVAFLTLVINATSAGPILKLLGLTDSPDVRKRIVKDYGEKINETVIDEYIRLLSDSRYHIVDFALVRHHVPTLRNLTLQDVKAAVLRVKDKMPEHKYERPVVDKLLPYLDETITVEAFNKEVFGGEEDERKKEPPRPARESVMAREIAGISSDDKEVELRKSYIEIMRFEYGRMIAEGNLSGREGFVVESLLMSLEFASDNVAKGGPLNDWEYSKIVDTPWKDVAMGTLFGILNLSCFKKCFEDAKITPPELQAVHHDLYRALAFIQGHTHADERFKEEFSSDEFSTAAAAVLEESKEEVVKAEELIESADQTVVESVISHVLCVILLNKASSYVEWLVGSGLLNNQEAETFQEEIDKLINAVVVCTVEYHPDQIDFNSNGTSDDADKGSAVDDGNQQPPVNEPSAEEETSGDGNGNVDEETNEDGLDGAGEEEGKQGE